MVISSALIVVGVVLNKVEMALLPEEDFLRVGQIAFLWLYGMEHLFFKPSQASVQMSLTDDSLHEGLLPCSSLPNVVVVQSESFFDVRKDYDLLKLGVLAQFDNICQESVQFGRLSVPAWGANTIRTESAFLTGLPARFFGVHQFSPYRYFMKYQPFTLAHALKEQGYRTICIHPYEASFYFRDRLYPQLGFDDFIDINAFSSDQKEGQYIGDVALAEKVAEILAEAEQPLFVFVITMENHGPLHLEQPLVTDKKLFYKMDKQPEGCDDLTVYARHLHNADKMAYMLHEQLQHNAREGVLCWYGDHVPIMADVYNVLGEPSGLTDYFVWSSKHNNASTNTFSKEGQKMDVSDLAALVLEQVIEKTCDG
jgi:phosphoglycerol transferase MdoB-like AlkP superfamily enzyme